MASMVAEKTGVSGGWTDGIWHDRLINVGAPARIFRVTLHFLQIKPTTEMWAGGCRPVEVEGKRALWLRCFHIWRIDYSKWDCGAKGTEDAECFQGWSWHFYPKNLKQTTVRMSEVRAFAPWQKIEKLFGRSSSSLCIFFFFFLNYSNFHFYLFRILTKLYLCAQQPPMAVITKSHSNYDHGQKHNSRSFYQFRVMIISLCKSNFQNLKHIHKLQSHSKKQQGESRLRLPAGCDKFWNFVQQLLTP